MDKLLSGASVATGLSKAAVNSQAFDATIDGQTTMCNTKWALNKPFSQCHLQLSRKLLDLRWARNGCLTRKSKAPRGHQIGKMLGTNLSHFPKVRTKPHDRLIFKVGTHKFIYDNCKSHPNLRAIHANTANMKESKLSDCFIKS